MRTMEEIQKEAELFIASLKEGKIKKNILPNSDSVFTGKREAEDFKRYNEFLDSPLGELISDNCCLQWEKGMTDKGEVDYEYLIKIFGEQAIKDRFIYVSMKIENFIKKYNHKAVVNNCQMRQVIVDYFADIARIKEFHSSIERINSVKRVAYLAYWLLRNKPIQLVDQTEHVMINELFALHILMIECFDCEKVDINNFTIDAQNTYKEYMKFLAYFIRYRNYNAQSFELAINSFKSGMKIMSNLTQQLSQKNFLHKASDYKEVRYSPSKGLCRF